MIYYSIVMEYGSRKRRRPYTFHIKKVSSHSKLKFEKISVPTLESHQDDVCLIEDPSVIGNSCCTGEDPDLENDYDSFQDAEFESQPLMKQSRKTDHWNRIRKSLIHALIESSAMPATRRLCTYCSSVFAEGYCEECGMCCLYCLRKIHNNGANFMHPLFEWKDEEGHYYRLDFEPTIYCSCECTRTDSSYFKKLVCADMSGQTSVNIEFCPCTDEFEVLMKLGLFPATPVNPSMVFTLKLFNWLEACILECQISLQDFVTALDIVNKSNHSKVDRSLYPLIIDSFEEYRQIKHEIRTLECLQFSDLIRRHGFKCPACFMSKDPVTVSIDGNFGLCRKKAAGTSAQQTHTYKSFFVDQSSVDSFVGQYKGDSSFAKDDCHHFLAVDALRSRTRYAALDETGVVGVVCKHEIPQLMLSLKHGERYAYIVFCLEKIKDQMIRSNMSHVNVLYDVACQLKRHLIKENRNDLLSFFHFSVPVFHSYGHKADCQLSFSPRNLQGFGMADGESCERLWSFLRRFARTTKEMRPSHRINVLSDALSYYSRLCSIRLATLMPRRLKRFRNLQFQSKNELSALMKKSPEDIQKWYQKEASSEKNANSNSNIDNWEENYIHLLESYYEIMAQLEREQLSPSTLSVISKHLIRIDKQLKEVELNMSIANRPLKESSYYRELQYWNTVKQSEKVKKKIAVLARERWFLLNLKAKFADGQYLASRLSKKITKVTSQLKSSITQYNEFGINVISWQNATNLSSPIWYEGIMNSDGIPISVKLEAIKLHNLILRCDEEESMLIEDMKRTLSFYCDEYSAIYGKITELKTIANEEQYSRGCIALLHEALAETIDILITLTSSFSPIIDVNKHFEEIGFTESSSVLVFTNPDSSEIHSDSDTTSSTALVSSTTLSLSNLSSTTILSSTTPFSSSISLSSSTNSTTSLLSTTMLSTTVTPTHAAETNNNEPIFPSYFSSKSDHNILLAEKDLGKVDMVQPTMQNADVESCDAPNKASEYLSDSDDEDEDDFFTQSNFRRQRLEKEEFLQELRKYETCDDLLSLEDRELLSSILERPISLGTHSTNFLQMSHERLRKALAFSSRGKSLQRVITAGPHFIQHNNN